MDQDTGARTPLLDPRESMGCSVRHNDEYGTVIGVEQLPGEGNYQVKIQWANNGSMSNHPWDSV
eukprot:9228552-Pyramimonas_sp.AAC.1